MIVFKKLLIINVIILTCIIYIVVSAGSFEDVKEISWQESDDDSSDLDSLVGNVSQCGDRIIRIYRDHDSLLTVSDILPGETVFRITEEDGLIQNPGNATAVCIGDTAVLAPFLGKIILLNLDSFDWSVVIDDDLEYYINTVSAVSIDGGYAVLMSYDDEQVDFLRNEMDVPVPEKRTGDPFSALLFFDEHFVLRERHTLREALYSSLAVFRQGAGEYMYFGFGSYDEPGGVYAFRYTDSGGAAMLWKYTDDLCEYGTIASPFADSVAGKVYIPDLCGNLITLDAFTGERLSVLEAREAEGEKIFSYASPVMTDMNADGYPDLIFVRNFIILSALNDETVASDGAENESFEEGDGSKNEHLFLDILKSSEIESAIIAVDGRSGGVLWESRITGMVIANPVVFTKKGLFARRTLSTVIVSAADVSAASSLLYFLKGADGSVDTTMPSDISFATSVLADWGGDGTLDILTLNSAHMIYDGVPSSVYSGFRGSDNRGSL